MPRGRPAPTLRCAPRMATRAATPQAARVQPDRPPGCNPTGHPGATRQAARVRNPAAPPRGQPTLLRNPVRVTCMLPRHVDPCCGDVRGGQRSRVVAAAPPEGCAESVSKKVDTTSGFRLCVAHKRRERHRRVVADDYVHVVCEDRLSMNAHSATLTSLKDRGSDFRHVCPANGLLPPPRVPRDVRVQPACFVRPTFAHRVHSGWVHGRTHTEGGYPQRTQGCTPRCRGATLTPARTPSPGSGARRRVTRAR